VYIGLQDIEPLDGFSLLSNARLRMTLNNYFTLNSGYRRDPCSALFSFCYTLPICCHSLTVMVSTRTFSLLNTAKTEFLWSTTSHRLHQLPQLPQRVGSDHIAPASVVRDLGIYIDSDVSMRSHVAKTVLTCHAVLRQLRTIRRSVSRSVLQSLVSSLVLSRLDYGNATLVGVSSHLLSRLQSVMNTAARLIFPHQSHSTSLRSCVSCIG